jgi:3-oxoacyl-[acyl-carrier protein] reductase
MMKARGGRIINITSVVGSTGNPGQMNYAAAKAGVEGMTRALAAKSAAATSPSTAWPRLHRYRHDQGAVGRAACGAEDPDPLGRLGQPEDIANAVAFLAGRRPPTSRALRCT